MLQVPEFIGQLSKHLFWDVDPARLDPEAHARFLIVRVVERGRRQDVRYIWEYYGDTRIREALLSAPSLGRHTIAFFANQFNLPRGAFRAYERSNHWAQ